MKNNILKTIDGGAEPVTRSQFFSFETQTDRNFSKIKSEVANIKKILEQHTKALVSIENTLKYYGDMYKINSDESRLLKQRVSVLESR